MHTDKWNSWLKVIFNMKNWRKSLILTPNSWLDVWRIIDLCKTRISSVYFYEMSNTVVLRFTEKWWSCSSSSSDHCNEKYAPLIVVDCWNFHPAQKLRNPICKRAVPYVNYVIEKTWKLDNISLSTTVSTEQLIPLSNYYSDQIVHDNLVYIDCSTVTST